MELNSTVDIKLKIKLSVDGKELPLWKLKVLGWVAVLLGVPIEGEVKK